MNCSPPSNHMIIPISIGGKCIVLLVKETFTGIVACFLLKFVFQVIWNPFDDIVPRTEPAKSLIPSTDDASSRVTKKKASK